MDYIPSLELIFLQLFREIPDLIFSYSSKGSMIHVIYCFIDAVKLVWSSESMHSIILTIEISFTKFHWHILKDCEKIHVWHLHYVFTLWTSYKEPTFEHARPYTGQTISSDYLYPRSISHVLFNAIPWGFPCALQTHT
jgi:hypothetical protein